MHRTMLFLLSLFLLPILIHCQKTTFQFNECWCRNDTHLAWNRYYRMDIATIDGPYESYDGPTGTPAEITEWCMEATDDGHGDCLDQHTKKYLICASYQAVERKNRRNDLCFQNHGNSRNPRTVWEYYAQSWPDHVGWNGQDFKLTLENAARPNLGIDDGLQLRKHCKSVCKNFQGWDLPLMYPWSPSKHGPVESQAFVWDYFRFENGDGTGGLWPVEEPPNEGIHKIHRGGITATGLTGEGTIDYYQCDQEPDIGDRVEVCKG
ncbi:MAG: hypothetical protein Q9212_000395 [Teloschistes hypoglaucus]